MKKAAVLITLLICITIGLYWSVKGSKFTNLDSCLKASVSKKIICSREKDYVSFKSISPYFLDAVVMSEDDKFYFHDGFDWKELKKSVMANARKFSFVRGGSTITQQLVKNVYLSQEKSIIRKVKEAYIAHQIEKKHSKKLILEKYVNAIEFGKDIWGIHKAARFYFKKHPSELGVLESLYLTILLPSPVKYSKSYFDGKLTDYQSRRIKTLLSRFIRRKIVDKDYGEFLKVNLDKFPWKSPLVFEPPVVSVEKSVEGTDVIITNENLEEDVENDEPRESFEKPLNSYEEEEIEQYEEEAEAQKDDLELDLNTGSEEAYPDIEINEIE